MRRRTAIKRIAGGVAAMFLGACSSGQGILDPLKGISSTGSPGALARRPTRHAYVPVRRTILVTVEENAIQVSPEVMDMTNLDPVSFRSTNGRGFSIAFDGSGPFAGRVLEFGEATSTRLPVRNGRFKYSVISDENPGLILDPVIIVEDPPTGPNP